MNEDTKPLLGRRKMLLGVSAAGAAAVLSSCTSNSADEPTANIKSGGDNSKPGKHVTLGFSAPAADHGFIAAISSNARQQAKAYSDVTLQATEGTNDVSTQIAAVQSMINKSVDAIVI
ncbi:MAG: sugar ABC transporter substrate-binding protein, partial [Nocardioidaceae bacterium]